jgi:hypothetical protein
LLAPFFLSKGRLWSAEVPRFNSFENPQPF